MNEWYLQGLVDEQQGGTTRAIRSRHVNSSFDLCNSNLLAFLRRMCPRPGDDNLTLQSSVLTTSETAVQKGSRCDKRRLADAFFFTLALSLGVLPLGCGERSVIFQTVVAAFPQATVVHRPSSTHRLTVVLKTPIGERFQCVGGTVHCPTPFPTNRMTSVHHTSTGCRMPHCGSQRISGRVLNQASECLRKLSRIRSYCCGLSCCIHV